MEERRIAQFYADFGIVQKVHSGDLPYYDGDYVVTPKSVEQRLETQEKAMRNDVTVEAISYIETDNDAGGRTVSIAS